MVADTGGQGLRSSGDGVDGQLTVTQVLPDGDTVLGHVGESAAGEAVLISLGRGEVRRLLPGKFPWYLDSGLLGYPFNRSKLRGWVTLVLARTIRSPWASYRPGSGPMRTA